MAALVAVALVLSACFAADDSSSAAAKPRSIFWGATIGTQFTGQLPPWDMRPLRRFERIAGKKVSAVGFAAPFVDCNYTPCAHFGFLTSLFEKVRRHGAIPFFSWATQVIPETRSQRGIQLRDIIGGRYDRFIRRFARGAKRWGHPFFLRFDHEMNGNWYPWSERANGNRRGQFVKMWRHVHRIFDRVGANNATWVWCPNVNIRGGPAIQKNLRSLYPGNRFVDWTCLDGFNWGVRPGSAGWDSFDRVYRRTYRQVVRIAPRKPIIIGEVGSSDRGGSKAAWIRHMLRVIPRRYRKIRGFLYFDVHDRGTNWPIETSRRAKRAFRRGIARRIYRPNRFENLPPGPVRPGGR